MISKPFERYPVKAGEIWRAGVHRFGCFDLEVSHNIYAQFGGTKPPGLIYSDPPWNTGNMKYWRTKADMGKPVDPDYFWGRFCDEILLSGISEPIFVESSIQEKHHHHFLRVAERHGFPVLANQWTIYYGSPPSSGQYQHCCGRPNLLFRFGRDDDLKGFNPTGLKGDALVKHVFMHYAISGETVFDPCVGKGTTARMAHKFGMTCFGVELDPKRLAITLDWLARRGLTVERCS